MDLESDLVPALQQLQQTDAVLKLQNVLRHVEAESSTKPPKPRDNMRSDQSSQHARLRQEAEGLHQSSLNGRYWQTGSSGSSHSACHQHETLIPMSHRARNRGVRTKLSW